MSTLTTSARARPPLLRSVDIVLVLLGSPVALLLGAPALGYGIGAAAWILIRGLEVALDAHAGGITDLTEQITLRIGYRLARVSLLVAAAVLAIKDGGRSDGLTALLVLTLAFTAQLVCLFCDKRGRAGNTAALGLAIVEGEPRPVGRADRYEDRSARPT